MKTADIRMQDEIKRKVATYYGFKGDWDQLVISCEQKIRDGMTGLPTIYIDKALEVAAQYRESGKPEPVEQEELTAEKIYRQKFKEYEGFELPPIVPVDKWRLIAMEEYASLKYINLTRRIEELEKLNSDWQEYSDAQDIELGTMYQSLKQTDEHAASLQAENESLRKRVIELERLNQKP